MPTLTDILVWLSAVPTTAALLGLAITAGFLIAATDWRISVFALAVQYVLSGLLLTRVIRPEIAAIKTLTGAMICVVLYITARRVDWGKLPPQPGEEPPGRLLLALMMGTPFRILAALMALALAYTAALYTPLPNVPLEVTLGVLTLGMMGLFCIALAAEPLKGGMGLLTAITSFDLFYSSVEQSLVMVGLLGMVNWMIALATSYLATSHAASPDEMEQSTP